MELPEPHVEKWLADLDALPCPADAERLYDPSTQHGRVRRGNLLHYLTLIAAGPPAFMLIGEAPGYRGSTVTGVPFMSAREASARPGLITGSGGGDGFEAVATDAPEWEATSRSIWMALAERPGPVPLMWSTYPHHPFLGDDPRTNRRPRPDEIRAGIPLAVRLAELFAITEFVAVGRVAEGALGALGRHAVAVRHPAQGGARIFADQMRAILRP